MPRDGLLQWPCEMRGSGSRSRWRRTTRSARPSADPRQRGSAEMRLLPIGRADGLDPGRSRHAGPERTWRVRHYESNKLQTGLNPSRRTYRQGDTVLFLNIRRQTKKEGVTADP